MSDLVEELRQLIIDSAPDPSRATAVKDCGPDEVLDGLIPFSSVIVLGVVIAIEERYAVVLSRKIVEDACRGGPTLKKLAAMIEELEAKK